MSKSEFLSELADISWAGRDTHILFDSDIAQKPGVQRAESRLADELMKRGAVVRKVRLPDAEDGSKVGVDDYLLKHTGTELVSLVSNTPTCAGGYEPPLPLAELMSNEYPNDDWVWPGLILKGEVNLLYGDGGLGKSTLAIHIMAAAALGKPLFDLPVARMPCLGLFSEDNNKQVQTRFRVALESLGARFSELPQVAVWCQPKDDTLLASVDENGSVKELPRLFTLRAELAKLKQPALLVLDGFADIFALNENLRPPVNAALKRVLGGLCRDFGATIVVLAHPSKASMYDGTGYSGSTAFNNAVRQRLILEKPKNDGEGVYDPAQRQLRVAKSNYGSETEISLWLHGARFTAKPSENVVTENDQLDAVLTTILKLIDRGVRVVNRNGNVGEARTLNEFSKTVHEETGLQIPSKQIKTILRRLVDQGALIYREADKSKRPHVKAGFTRGVAQDE